MPPRRVHKRKLLHTIGESIRGTFGALCDERTYRRVLHELWSEVTCPDCLALRPATDTRDAWRVESHDETP